MCACTGVCMRVRARTVWSVFLLVKCNSFSVWVCVRDCGGVSVCLIGLMWFVCISRGPDVIGPTSAVRRCGEKKESPAKHREDERVPCVVVLSSFGAASVALVRLQIKLIPADRCACVSNVVVYFLDSRSTLCGHNIYLVIALPLVVNHKL